MSTRPIVQRERQRSSVFTLTLSSDEKFVFSTPSACFQRAFRRSMALTKNHYTLTTPYPLQLFSDRFYNSFKTPRNFQSKIDNPNERIGTPPTSFLSPSKIRIIPKTRIGDTYTNRNFFLNSIRSKFHLPPSPPPFQPFSERLYNSFKTPRNFRSKIDNRNERIDTPPTSSLSPSKIRIFPKTRIGDTQIATFF